jgi:hypothetical protein
VPSSDDTIIQEPRITLPSLGEAAAAVVAPAPVPVPAPAASAEVWSRRARQEP